MKITFVLPGLFMAGGIRVIFEYATLLKKRGHEINIIYPLLPYIIYPKSKKKYISSLIFGFLSNLKRNTYTHRLNYNADTISVPFYSKKYTKYIEKFIPDSNIVIATSWETAYFVSELSNIKGEKYYFVQHYEIWDIWNNIECWKKINKNKLKDQLPISMSYIVPENSYLYNKKKIVDETYNLSLKIITISSWLKKLINTSFGQKVYGMITNGVNFDTFYCNNTKKWANTKKIILMPYRNIPWKGDFDGINALDKIKKMYRNKVEIIFFGPNKPYNLPKWVKFYQKPNDEELRQLYCKAHIFVLPSWVEGCQLPPMEAMACKCAVVATNVGGVPDYAIHNETALVVPPQDPQRIIDEISKLLTLPEFAEKIAIQGHNYIKQFTWDRATDELENILLNEK